MRGRMRGICFGFGFARIGCCCSGLDSRPTRFGGYLAMHLAMHLEMHLEMHAELGCRLQDAD
jgi:hypothetical protein